MIPFANRLKVWLLVIFCGTRLAASAQLGSTNLDGLQIQVIGLYRSGDTRDLDCSIGFRFTGEAARRATGFASVKIISAMDDTGRDLIRTNRQVDNFGFSGFQQIVHGLKAPAPSAKTIRHLEAEVDLLTRTDITVTLTNFRSSAAQSLRHPVLDQLQIKLVYKHMADEPPPGSLVIDNRTAKRITLNIEGPNHKIVSLAFQSADGKVLQSHREQPEFGAKSNDQTYSFAEVPPADLKLALTLAGSETTNRVHFTVENIRLPWHELPALEVTAEAGKIFPSRGTNPVTCYLTFSFTGGQLTNALGIRNLWISRAEDDAGRPVQILWPSRTFTGLPPAGGDGRNVRKLVPFVFESPNPKAIRMIQGEAELVSPAKTNDYVVIINDFMSQPGKPFDLPLLNRHHVKLTYLGLVNYAAEKSNLAKTNWLVENSGLLVKEVPSDYPNSLLFTLDDPERAVIAPWGDSELTVLDDLGRVIPVFGQLTAGSSLSSSGNLRVYRFKTMPPKGAKLRVCLAVSECLQRVPFQIKNIGLPQTPDSR